VRFGLFSAVRFGPWSATLNPSCIRQSSRLNNTLFLLLHLLPAALHFLNAQPNRSHKIICPRIFRAWISRDEDLSPGARRAIALTDPYPAQIFCKENVKAFFVVV
jgi:hypothetical protein